MKRILYTLVLALFMLNSGMMRGAEAYYFYVQLADKHDSPYSLDEPLEFLSQRALDRRAFYAIALDASDLPVNPNYKAGIEALGVSVHSVTKWLNGVTVQVVDSSLMADVRALPFVEFVQFTGINKQYMAVQAKRVQSSLAENFNYGVAATQIDQMNGRYLHQKNYTGEGIYIAVLDAGFNNADIVGAFEHLRNEGRLLGVKNIVNPNRSVYLEHSHGTHVLSSMAGVNTAPAYVGTAPGASYLLIQTEDNGGEYLCEPDFWISGMEYADSIGVDISTTSLGYTEFDDISMNYSYADLDGNTARASIAANMAFAKGILVFNSAGNEGDKSWKYISVPADASGVITVGAVTSTGARSAFSSIGPSFDSRLKPELVAMGSSSALIGANGAISYSSGTSFSCPILAGMSACFLQATREKSPTLSLEEVRQLMYQSGSQYYAPDNYLGYGLPDFQAAYDSMAYTGLNKLVLSNKRGELVRKIVVDATLEQVIIKTPVQLADTRTAYLQLINTAGQSVREQRMERFATTIDVRALEKGIYILRISEK